MSTHLKLPDVDVAVVGAGLQGCCLALELARRGCTVALLDRDPRPMNRASRRNEGKVHLGLVYAMDETGATAELQLRGALSFAPLLERWLGPGTDAWRASTPFDYVVARDSIASPAELAGHYAQLQRRYEARCARWPEGHYLASRPERLAELQPAERWADRYDPARVQAVFATAERAIDCDRLADAVARAVAAEPRIVFAGATRVASIERQRTGWQIVAEGPAGPMRRTLAAVVNAAWDGRLALDRSAGLEPEPGWVHRLKYRVVVRTPAACAGAASATMVVGRYGDVVFRPDGTAYLSWYPAAMRGWSHEIAPPADWERACRGETEPRLAAELAGEFGRALSAWHLGLRANVSETLQVDGGAIFAHGRSDVHDPASGLHRRTQVGVVSRDGYHSVNPGKLTTAPLFAVVAADAVTGRRTGPTEAWSRLAEEPLDQVEVAAR